MCDLKDCNNEGLNVPQIVAAAQIAQHAADLRALASGKIDEATVGRFEARLAFARGHGAGCIRS